ncbi:hypothetical protein BBJ28_00021548 [Nothophytophthora sp. Chile5]|nr:hypothetical protein BBJ28_00021548 [Nothophytophthora sp. Chile5]
MATAWDAVTAELLRKVASVDTDVQFRRLALRHQCEQLEATLAYVRGLQAARAAALEARRTAQEAEAQETVEVGQSIAAAIRRARAIREELSVTQAAREIDDADGASDNSHEEEEEEEENPTRLNEILATAKATRALLTTSEATAVETPASPPKLRLEYPHKVKAAMDQLEELRAQEHVASRRFAFCCKMSEHLSLSSERRQSLMERQRETRGSSALDMPVARIQASYPKQVARLRHAYKSLATFLLEKIEVDSPAFQQVVQTPTLSSAFPIYHRLRQVTTCFLELVMPSKLKESCVR